jgi:site-specific DNA-methyltransferase (adenine-specific)
MTLPKPYYQDDAVTIYHADCRDILPDLPKVDLVLTDPPYGIDYQSSRRTDNQRKDKIFGDKEFPLWLFNIKPLRATFVFCRWDILPILPLPKSFIVWDKLRHSMGDLNHEYGRQWEAISFYPEIEHQFIGRPIDIIRVPCVPACDLQHPNEKPAAVVAHILTHNVGDIILDPFLGSGTTAFAAKKLGRKCIGIEIEEKYCEIAAKRCSQTVMDLNTP